MGGFLLNWWTVCKSFYRNSLLCPYRWSKSLLQLHFSTLAKFPFQHKIEHWNSSISHKKWCQCCTLATQIRTWNGQSICHRVCSTTQKMARRLFLGAKENGIIYLRKNQNQLCCQIWYLLSKKNLVALRPGYRGTKSMPLLLASFRHCAYATNKCAVLPCRNTSMFCIYDYAYDYTGDLDADIGHVILHRIRNAFIMWRNYLTKNKQHAFFVLLNTTWKPETLTGCKAFFMLLVFNLTTFNSWELELAHL